MYIYIYLYHIDISILYIIYIYTIYRYISIPYIYIYIYTTYTYIYISLASMLENGGNLWKKLLPFRWSLRRPSGVTSSSCDRRTSCDGPWERTAWPRRRRCGAMAAMALLARARLDGEKTGPKFSWKTPWIEIFYGQFFMRYSYGEWDFLWDKLPVLWRKESRFRKVGLKKIRYVFHIEVQWSFMSSRSLGTGFFRKKERLPLATNPHDGDYPIHLPLLWLVNPEVTCLVN